jgi:SRSO17 transposase
VIPCGTKVALGQIRKALRDGIPAALALADAAYDDNYDFREGITELGLRYVVGVRERTTIWNRENPRCPRNNRKGRGAPARGSVETGNINLFP